MSATLRYDIGLKATQALTEADPNILTPFGARTTSRWAGVHRDRNQVCTFAINLPRQAGAAWRLLELLDRLRHEAKDTLARNGCLTLRRKLTASLGLSVSDDTTQRDRAFLTALKANPGDLTTWAVYADWLQEQDGPGDRTRATVIRGWLGPKAVKTKYGIPVITRWDYREESEGS